MSETQIFIQRFIAGFELSDGLYLALVVVLGIIAFGMFALWTRSSFAGLLAAGIMATSALWATVPSCVYASDCLFGMPKHFASVIAISPMLICFAIGFAIWCFKTDRREASDDARTS